MRIRGMGAFALMLTAGLILSACTPAPAPPPTPTPPITSTIAPTPTPTPTPDPLAGWTIEQLVGQVFMVGVHLGSSDDSVTALIRDRHLGNIFLHGRSAAGVDSVRAQVSSFTSLVSPETKSQGLFHQIQKEVTFCGLPHGADA